MAIQEATELGAGLRLAMRDMEIRGAGNILGAEQSGHIAAIGYELYIRLLAQAVEEIRSGEPRREIGPVIMDLPLTALIPADYIVDTELRLAIYRRIAAVEDERQLDEVRQELEDRFGPIPEEVEHLLALIALRIRAQALGIESMIEREREIVIRPVPTAGLERRLVSRLGRAVKLTAHSIRIRLPDLTIPWREAVDVVLEAVESTQPGQSGAQGASRVDRRIAGRAANANDRLCRRSFASFAGRDRSAQASCAGSQRTNPRRASSAMIRRAFSSGVKPTVSSVISGFSGDS